MRGVTAQRIEAFSDGVIAILITIMVLELRIPSGSSAHDLRGILPGFLCYVLSFVNLGIYWNNHHHLLKTVERVTGAVLWANLLLLFCLSLVPVATAWMSLNHFATLPVAVYGMVLLACGVSYYVLSRAIISAAAADDGSLLESAIGHDMKGVASVVIYAIAVGMCAVSRWIALALYVVVSVLWLVPDRRLATRIAEVAEAAEDPAS